MLSTTSHTHTMLSTTSHTHTLLLSWENLLKRALSEHNHHLILSWSDTYLTFQKYEQKNMVYRSSMTLYKETTMPSTDAVCPQIGGHTQTLTWQGEADELPRVQTSGSTPFHAFRPHLRRKMGVKFLTEIMLSNGSGNFMCLDIQWFFLYQNAL